MAGFVGITAAMVPLHAVRAAVTAKDEREALRDRWTRAWARMLLRLFSITCVRDGRPVQPAAKGRLVVANQ